MGRAAQPVEEAFSGVSLEEELHVLAARPRTVQKTPVNRGREVAGRSCRHGVSAAR